jgi:hypothetical protein
MNHAIKSIFNTTQDLYSALFVLFIFFLLSLSEISFSQDNTKILLNPQIENKIKEITLKEQDSMNLYLRRLETVKNNSIIELKKYCDSVISDNKDALNNENRKDFNKLIQSGIDSINIMIEDSEYWVTDLSYLFDSTIIIMKSKKYTDINKYFENLMHFDSVVNDSLSKLEDEFRMYFMDSFEGIKESIVDFVDDLIVVRKSSLTISTEYNSAYSYHGKKIEGDQPVLNTYILYSHFSGLRLSANYLALTKKLSSLGELELSLGYKYSIFENLDLKVDYTRLFYKTASLKYSTKITDTSNNLILRNNPQNILRCAINYSIESYIDVGGNFNYSFTPGKDYEILMVLSRSFTFEKILFSHDIDLDPGLNLYYGSIYSLSNSKNKDNSLVKEGQLQQKFSGFAIFNYELSLSLSYNLYGFFISLNYSYNILQNELKKQGGANFSSLTYGLLYRF